MNLDPSIRLILARYAVEQQSARIEPLGMAGGLSGAHFWRVSFPERSLVLRRWPAEHPTADRLRWIHAMLRHAYERNITILAVPLTTRSGQTFVEHNGHFWELAPWLPGEADYHRTPRDEKLRAAMRALATFHHAVADFTCEGAMPGPTAVERRLSRLHQLTRHEMDALTSAVDDATWPELAPLAREFVAMLPSAAARARALLEPFAGVELPSQPCIRDVWHDHILFTGDEVTGMIDFGAADIDTPAIDVSRLLGSLVGDDRDRWNTGLTAYESVRPLSTQERKVLPALDASGTVIALCNWVRWIYIERRQFENREHIVARFARLLHRARILVARHSVP